MASSPTPPNHRPLIFNTIIAPLLDDHDDHDDCCMVPPATPVRLSYESSPSSKIRKSVEHVTPPSREENPLTTMYWLMYWWIYQWMNWLFYWGTHRWMDLSIGCIIDISIDVLIDALIDGRIINCIDGCFDGCIEWCILIDISIAVLNDVYWWMNTDRYTLMGEF